MSDSISQLTFLPTVESAFKHGYELHVAAARALRYKGDVSLDHSLSPAQSTQKQALIELSVRILIAERNKELDEFALSWVKSRKLDVNSP